MLNQVDAEWLAKKIRIPTRQAIISRMTVLINNNTLPSGTLLPSVRKLASALRVSPATVSGAWQILKKYQMIGGNGKQGIQVMGKPGVSPSLRFDQLNDDEITGKLDLSCSSIDVTLLPDVGKAVTQAAKIKPRVNPQFLTIYPQLEAAITPLWPYPAEAFMCVHDSFTALDFLLNIIVLPGASIAVEDPSAFTHFDILKKMAIKIIPVACDDKGPLPSSLSDALRQHPIAFIYQPRNNVASGHVVDPPRLAELAKSIESYHAFIIEHDLIGDISAQTALSLGSYYPDRTIHIRSYTKTYGPDLNLAVLSSSKRMIQQIQYYASLTHSWPSRLLQHALAWLITDTATQQQLDRARTIYRERYNYLIGLLNQRGLELPYGDNLCLWLPVRSAEYAIDTLAERDIIAISGEHFGINTQSHVRIATAILTEQQADRIVDVIIRAIKPPVIVWRMHGLVL